MDNGYVFKIFVHIFLTSNQATKFSSAEKQFTQNEKKTEQTLHCILIIIMANTQKQRCFMLQ